MGKITLTKLSGIAVFLLSFTLYIFTLEPTTSFWDCSEFILSAAKLEVNHPAGAPLFMLLGRMFTFLSFGDPQKIAWTINLISGFFSALTVFFLFHVLVKLVKKLTDQNFVAIGSAVLGALAFAVSDSFWFSAVEGEVYALSMFFLVLTFWAALKWEEDFDDAGNPKWLFFMALITGLGIGVHLLNLLVLPTAVMIVGFRKYGYSLRNMLLFFGLGTAALFGVLYVLTPLVMKTLARFDFAFVNQLGLPLHSGAIFGIVFILTLLAGSIYYFRKKGWRVAETSALTLLFILLGFSVYSVNIIRSSAEPPVNFGRPNNIYSLIDYLNREQYPKRPLLFGQNYNSPVTGVNERFSKDFLEGEYRVTGLAPTYEYDNKTCAWFPRMYSRDENHIRAYNSWVKIRGKRVSVKQPSGERKTLVVPTQKDNLGYFMRYQFGYMFGRYFMWNFVGRQNDRQGRGEVLNGNWISGVGFIDNVRLGPQDKLPDWLKNNRARNTYFFLPLILGLIGAVFHYKKHSESFFAVLALFIMGGLGLTVYINEIPITPRERDYVFVGAFLAFSIWMGMSFWALAGLILKKRFLLPLYGLLFLVGPGLMLYQNFDDHDRSGRYAARDLAVNILQSCPQDAILFTSGDNDTYPLLYCQEVEGIRRDVRIVIMPFLAANWFIDGLRDEKYHDAGLEMTLPQLKYDRGELDYVPVIDRLKRDTSWREALEFLKIDNENAKVKMSSGESVNFLPLTRVNFEVKAEGKTGKIDVSLADKKMLYKHQLAFWDIVSSNATARPLCFVSKLEAQRYGLSRNLKCEGFVYRLVPEKSRSASLLDIGNCDPLDMYDKLTGEFAWGNIADPAVYADWNTLTSLNIFQVRNVFSQVARLLLQEGEKEKAAELVETCLREIPLSKLPHDIFTIRQAELLLGAGRQERARELFLALEKETLQTLEFFAALPQSKRMEIKDEVDRQLYYLNSLAKLSAKIENEEKTRELSERLNEFVKVLM